MSESEPLPDPPSETADFQLASQPHDAYFKQVFSDPAHAAAFFRSHLPAPVSRAIQWQELAVVPGSFIKRTLTRTHADLLFSASAGGQKLLLYLLLEHQTTVDRTMPLRLLVYMTEIWLSHERAEGLPLPPVIPFVLHQGPEGWNVPTQFADLIGMPHEIAEPLRPFLPAFQHGLLDLSRCDPASEESDPALRFVLQLMKLARERERILEFWEQTAREGCRLPEALLFVCLTYTLHVDASLDVEDLTHRLRHNPELQRTAMSAAENLFAKGIAKGRVEGRVEGRVQGEWIGQIRMLEKIMKRPVSAKAELESKSAEELEQQFNRLQSEYDARFKNY